MMNQTFMSRAAVVGCCLLSFLAAPSFAQERPNFLWILSEDNSKHFLRLFDPQGAPTPHIERLAAEGLAFDRAFSCSPVCSVARTTLMTGVYAPRLGTQFHRQLKPVRLPSGWHLFPAYLREAGYYTSNNSKTDYNTRGHEGVWDESSRQASWRRRPRPETPFLHMQTFTTTHESSLHFSRADMEAQATKTYPEGVELAPYHPDTPLFRHTYARYHDRVREVDRQVGTLVAQLEEDGLLEDTFIFYFGDHGGVLPGSKGYLRETGLHVPLVVRIPDKWKHWVDAPRDTRVNGFVSFVDFAPTVLLLAGVKVPPHWDGRPFLGPNVTLAAVNARREAFGYADRFDEKCEMARSLRQGRYKYVRHFQGYYPDSLQNNYRYNMLAYREWRELFRQEKLNDAQRQFFEPKPAETLYDLESDPYEVRNLTGDPAHGDALRRLRARLAAWMRDLPDLSLYPESYLVEQALDDPLTFAANHRKEIAELARVADLALLPFTEARPELEKALSSPNPWIRYWALTDCSLFGPQAAPLKELARERLMDDRPVVRIRAAEFLGAYGTTDPRPVLREVLRTSDSPVVSLMALNAVVYLKDGPRQWDFDIAPADVKARNSEVDRRLKYLAPESAR